MRKVLKLEPHPDKDSRKILSALSRRNFLKMAAGGVAGGAIAALGFESLSSKPGAFSGTMSKTDSMHVEVLQNLDKFDFRNRLGDVFTVQKDTLESVEVRLVEVSDSRSSSLDAYPETEFFSLMFQGPSGQTLSQGTYAIENHSIGTFPLFIVPLRPEGGELYYEAVFNRV